METFYLTQTNGLWIISEQPTEHRVTVEAEKINKWLEILNLTVKTLEEPKVKKPRRKKAE
jgi:hypothetical protein